MSIGVTHSNFLYHPAVDTHSFSLPHLTRTFPVNLQQTDGALVDLYFEILMGKKNEYRDDIDQWVCDVLTLAQGLKASHLKTAEKLIDCLPDHIGFSNAYLLLSRCYQQACQSQAICKNSWGEQEEISQAIHFFGEKLTCLVNQHHSRKETLTIPENHVRFDKEQVNPVFLKSLKESRKLRELTTAMGTILAVALTALTFCAVSLLNSPGSSMMYKVEHNENGSSMNTIYKRGFFDAYSISLKTKKNCVNLFHLRECLPQNQGFDGTVTCNETQWTLNEAVPSKELLDCMTMHKAADQKLLLQQEEIEQKAIEDIEILIAGEHFSDALDKAEKLEGNRKILQKIFDQCRDFDTRKKTADLLRQPHYYKQLFEEAVQDKNCQNALKVIDELDWTYQVGYLNSVLDECKVTHEFRKKILDSVQSSCIFINLKGGIVMRPSIFGKSPSFSRAFTEEELKLQKECMSDVKSLL
jgi:hypothetical protein